MSFNKRKELFEALKILEYPDSLTHELLKSQDYIIFSNIYQFLFTFVDDNYKKVIFNPESSDERIDSSIYFHSLLKKYFCINISIKDLHLCNEKSVEILLKMTQLIFYHAYLQGLSNQEDSKATSLHRISSKIQDIDKLNKALSNENDNFLAIIKEDTIDLSRAKSILDDSIKMMTDELTEKKRLYNSHNENIKKYKKEIFDLDHVINVKSKSKKSPMKPFYTEEYQNLTDNYQSICTEHVTRRYNLAFLREKHDEIVRKLEISKSAPFGDDENQNSSTYSQIESTLKDDNFQYENRSYDVGKRILRILWSPSKKDYDQATLPTEEKTSTEGTMHKKEKPKSLLEHSQSSKYVNRFHKETSSIINNSDDFF